VVPARGPRLPHGWITGAAAMGRPYWCRRRLDGLGERSRLAVPGHTLIRALATALPAASRRGRRPRPPWPRVEAGRAALDESAWQRLDVRDGSKGPLGVEMVTRRVGAPDAAAAPRPRGAGSRAPLPRSRPPAGGAGRCFSLQRCAWATAGAIGPGGPRRPSQRSMPPAPQACSRVRGR